MICKDTLFFLICKVWFANNEKIFYFCVKNAIMAKRLFVFNPEHDLVLAWEKRGGRLTPPRAARLLRHDLGFLPAFMAENDDWVMVDDVEAAQQAATPFSEYLPDVRWVSPDEISRMPEKERHLLRCCPWGWDEDVRTQLIRIGMNESLMPTAEDLVKIRSLSHRASTIGLLDEMVKVHRQTIGERRSVDSLDDAKALMRQWHKVVVKAPWSSSGRGVRFIEHALTASEEGFIRHVLEQQKSVVVEPYYDCVLNFALEFSLRENHTVAFDGISVFNNTGAAYTGNLLAPEHVKRAMLEEHIGHQTLLDITSHIVQWLDVQTKKNNQQNDCGDRLFSGPVGVDMMLVRTSGGMYVHPCVEVNLRCTMGHIALHVERRTQGKYRLMAIRYEKGRYSLAVE